jgi:hypothetical protein
MLVATFDFAVDMGTRLQYVWNYNDTVWEHMFHDRLLKQERERAIHNG